jgi:pyridoxamine 5'-phosphate oxidase
MNTDPFTLNPLLAAIRKDFIRSELTERSVFRDPLMQFEEWLADAFANGNEFANAMTLATVDGSGMPDARIMLLRNISNGGFTFFTNYNSKKGADILANPKGSLLFFWPERERQVRVAGVLSKLSPKVSDEYFASRPFESQVGAHVSQQSSVLADRTILDRKYEAALADFTGKDVPRPGHWGGYLLKPHTIEFWQGRANRLHDRLRYSLNEKHEWIIERLSP